MFRTAACQGLERHFSAVDGIKHVRSNPACAAVIVQYDSDHLVLAELAVQIQSYLRDNSPVISQRRFSAEERHHPEAAATSLRASLVRFAGLSALTAFVFVREVIFKASLAQRLTSPLGIIVSLAALPMVGKGLQSIRQRRFTLDSFLGGSIIAACAAGEATAALEILWISSGGSLLQDWITERSRQSIRDILQVTEKNTCIMRDGIEIEVAVSDVRRGDTVIAHTGEKIAVDGTLSGGEAVVDESSISGRAEPVARRTGDKVFAGTLVRQGRISILAEEVGDKTYLARVLQMVEQSLENKAPIQGAADRLAADLVKVGFGVTFATWLITRSLWRAFTVMLVMACPCATILAASTAVSAALSAAARRHILIKGGRYLEEVGQADVICFDKTGTLTTNEPELCRLVNLSAHSDAMLYQLAVSAEMHNVHPLAAAVQREAKRRNIAPIPHEERDYILGKGVRSVINGHEILVGSMKLMEQYAIDSSSMEQYAHDFRQEGFTIVYIAWDKELIGALGFASPDRPDIDRVIDFLKNDGVREIAMITGDEKHSARHLCSRLKIEKCFDSIMPEKKADIIDSLKQDGHKVLMVGDGINDSLALAQADIGMAMGAGGSDVAIEAADIALVKDELSGLMVVRSLSHATIRVVHQNFWIATGTNLIGVVLGALGILSPVTAGMLHIGHTLGILANSGRLLIFEPPLSETQREASPPPKEAKRK